MPEMTNAETPPPKPEAEKKSRRLNLIILLAAAVLILNGVFNHVVSTANAGKEMLKVGSKLPDFSLKTPDGTVVTNRNFTGKPVLYFFFANWCPCSHTSAAFIKQAIDAKADKNLVACGVGIQDTPENIQTFIKRHGFTFPVGNRGGDEMASSIGIRTTPTTLMVDADGVIRWVFVGKIEYYGQIDKGLAALFKEPVKAVAG